MYKLLISKNYFINTINLSIIVNYTYINLQKSLKYSYFYIIHNYKLITLNF